MKQQQAKQNRFLILNAAFGKKVSGLRVTGLFSLALNVSFVSLSSLVSSNE